MKESSAFIPSRPPLLALLLTASLLLAPALEAWAYVYRVKPGGTGDGSSGLGMPLSFMAGSYPARVNIVTANAAEIALPATCAIKSRQCADAAPRAQYPLPLCRPLDSSPC